MAGATNVVFWVSRPQEGLRGTEPDGEHFSTRGGKGFCPVVSGAGSQGFKLDSKRERDKTRPRAKSGVVTLDIRRANFGLLGDLWGRIPGVRDLGVVQGSWSVKAAEASTLRVVPAPWPSSTSGMPRARPKVTAGRALSWPLSLPSSVGLARGKSHPLRLFCPSSGASSTP